MARKTLKQKLKSQLRQTVVQMDEEHAKAGLTIQYENQVMQSVAMAHGIMATLMLSREVLGEESEQFKQIQTTSHGRIAQCMMALTSMGLTHEEANRRITQGH